MAAKAHRLPSLAPGLAARASELRVYHCLTNIGLDDEGARAARQLLASGAFLRPAGRRSESWPTISGGSLLPIDRLAGDDRLLFFTPNETLYGSWPETDGTVPTLEFSLATLFEHGAVGWRPHDLMGNYDGLVRTVGDRPSLILRQFADLHTTWDPETVVRLVEIDLEVSESLGRDGWEGSLAEKEVPEEVRQLVREIRLLVSRMQGAVDSFDCDVNKEHAEIVLEGEIPMREAVRYLDAERSAWLPVEART